MQETPETRLDPWIKKIPWRRKWQPTAVSLPGKSHGQRSLAGYSLWDHKESDIAEHACTAGYKISVSSNKILRFQDDFFSPLSINSFIWEVRLNLDFGFRCLSPNSCSAASTCSFHDLEIKISCCLCFLRVTVVPLHRTA